MIIHGVGLLFIIYYNVIKDSRVMCSFLEMPNAETSLTTTSS